VKSLSFASDTPMDGNTWIESYHSPSSSGDHQTYMTRVAPEYFKTMGIPLLAGRDYRWSDTRTSGLKIILNASAAKTLFPGQNAIGQHIQEGKKDYEVVGLVGDVHYSSIQKAAPAGGYLPMMQDEGKKPSYAAIVRVDGPVLPLADAARTLAAKMSPDIPAPAVTSISSDVDDSISSERMMALLAGFFAACALLVTAIGLYGTLAYATSRRTSEIGIRMALGAQRMQVVSLVFRENAWVAAGGSLAGMIVALVASRALASFLYGTSVRDPWVLAGSVMALAITASAASLVPALRASRIEPIQGLRSE
jgi:predicted permease